MTASVKLSTRARLAARSSALTLAGAMLVAGNAATAQEAPNPSSPSADPTSAASVQSAPIPADGRPQSSAQPDAAATGPATAAPAPQADIGTPGADAAAPADVDDIVVTGIRASLASSAKIKRDATLIVDSVSAEDVGKLPDVSIADSLARIPGVTAQRLEGRDQRLSIRGLGPDFSTTLLNGREQVTVGDNRGVEFDQYPSEFFQNVNVYKSADASLIAAGIAGTVDLRMLRPLASNKRVIALNARGQMNGIDNLNPDSSRYGYRASATYVDQFADDTFGLAIGVSATQTPSQDERFNARGYQSLNDDGTGPLVISGAKPYVQSNEPRRYGAVATLEWNPSDTFYSTFDALYSHFTEEQHLRGIEFPLRGGVGVDGTTVNSEEDGFATDTTFTGVHGIQRNDYNKRTAENFSLGWNNDIALSDRVHFNVDASWSRATRTDFLLETYTGAGYQKAGPDDTITATRIADGITRLVPTLDYTDTSIFKLTDPQGWGYNGVQPVVQAGFLNRPSFKDDLKSLRASFNGEIDSGLMKSWKVGANYSQRKKTSAYQSYFLCPVGGNADCSVTNSAATSPAVSEQAILGENIPLDYLGVPAVLALDPLYLYNNALQGAFDGRPGSLVRDNTVTEKVWSGYAKLTLDGEVGGRTLKGSLGLQVVRTDQSSNGQIAGVVDGVVLIAPAREKEIYTNFLPSGTMSLELIPRGFVKLGASQTMVRPRLDQERVTQDVGININNIGLRPFDQNLVFTSNGGNVNLKPYQSTNIDLSFEKCFSGGGYLVLSGYFKYLTDFVNSTNTLPQDFSSLVSTLTADQQAEIIASGQQIGQITRPENNGSGYLLGLEATASLPFKLFSPALDGFGVFVTGNYTKSEITYAKNPTPITLPGLSDWSAAERPITRRTVSSCARITTTGRRSWARSRGFRPT